MEERAGGGVMEFDDGSLIGGVTPETGDAGARVPCGHEIRLPDRVLFCVGSQPDHGKHTYWLTQNDADLINAISGAYVDAAREQYAAQEALRAVERNCPCGARPESPQTHPHVGGCPVGVALARVSQQPGSPPVGPSRSDEAGLESLTRLITDNLWECSSGDRHPDSPPGYPGECWHAHKFSPEKAARAVAAALESQQPGSTPEARP